MRLKLVFRSLTILTFAAGAVIAQSQAISNVQVTGLTSTSATITFSTGEAIFGGVNYAPASGSWTTVNGAYATNQSVTLTGLTPGTQYSYQPWYSGAVGLPTYTFTTPANSGPTISNVQVTNLTSTSATITFSTGVAIFSGVNYAPASGSWTTVNGTYGVSQSIALTGLTPGTQYSYQPWYSGAVGLPTYNFTTPGNSSPTISAVQVTNLTATSATITFSTSEAIFCGVNYAPANGSWTTLNGAYGVSQSIALTGLTPGTQYSYEPWYSGETSLTTYSFTTPAAPANPTVTNFEVGSSVIRTGMKRVGMNIEGQDFYDSGQLLRNLTFRNPGFEGETWQSILQCAAVTATSCTDSNVWTQWPANFLAGATFQFIYGAAKGQTGTVISSTAASSSGNVGATVNFASIGASPAVGDFFVVKMTIPGNAQDGWWPATSGGGTLSTDSTDLSPETPGKQALSMNASGQGQVAQVDSYFDTTNTHNFVLINGTYQLTFRAKGMGGNNQLVISFGRQIAGGTYFTQSVTLTQNWQDYTYTFSAAETSSTPPGTLDLRFVASGANVYLDDVSLTPATASSWNPTAFRDPVVSTLLALQPGTLRYMDDGGPAFGSSINNMIAPAFARQRSGSSEAVSEEDDVPLGLNEFLQLCQTVGAEPWYNLPPAISTTEMQNLMEFLGGASSTTYGAMRAALGQTAPWTSVFPVIHLELGNEEWNNVTFPGNSMNNAAAYSNQVTTIFGAAKSSPYYNSVNFDLIMGTQVVNTDLTGEEITDASNYDSISVAPYMFGSFNDTSSTANIFGPMFAEPEMWDSVPTGWMYQQQQAVTGAGKNLVTYEENIGTQSGTASQSMVNAVVPSVAAGVMMADHMLLQMRDLGIGTQNVWALPGYQNTFDNTNGGSETTPVFGTVVDMGGQSNLQRPVFLAEQLVNSAILPEMLGITVSGANPTWNQPLSTNDSVQLSTAHELQSFAFTDGASNASVVVVNLNQTAALPITFSGPREPAGTVTVSQLTSANLTDSNESRQVVSPTSTVINGFQPATPYSLPPFSVTVFSWKLQ